MGKSNLVCCGVKDLAESILSNCIFAIVYGGLLYICITGT